MTSRMIDELGLLTAEGREAQVRFERTLAAPPEEVWTALTDPERVARWLGRLSGDLRVGGAYALDMGDDGSSGASDERATGEVLACEPPTRVLLTWSFPGEDPSEVEARVEPRGGGSVLHVEHRRLSRGAARGYGAGWHAFLDHLGLLLVGREDEWTDRFDDLLPTYRRLLAAVGPVHVEATDDRLVSADPAATAEFLGAWLGWTEGGAAPGRPVLHGVPGRAGLAVVERDPATDDAPADVTLTWADVESLRESLVSAVGSGGRLAAGEPGDVGADGAELVCPGQVRLRVRAEAGGAPGA
ncbi:SRPBCC family protein [Cellulomonas sp. NPDC055163]